MIARTKISREHYFSADILERIGKSPISGLAWLNGEVKDLSPASLTSKILCERHNSVLSPLDAEAGKLFDALGEIDAALGDTAPPAPSKEWVLNGADLERWLLKTLLGVARAKGLTTTKIRDEADLIPVLFGEALWRPWWGLHLAPRETGDYYFKGFGLQTLTNGDEVWGIHMTLAGLRFLLSFGEADRDNAGYHTAGVRFNYAGRPGMQTITFTWPGRPYAQYLPLTRERPYQGEPVSYL